MGKTLIFGHKNPDTDSICSAIVYADLKTKLGADVEPVRLGEISSETQFVLDTFKVDAPRLVETVANEANEVILVDHNERQQSANDIDKVQVVEVIDHHRIANFETSNPLYYRAEPVGCTTTILKKLYKEHGVEISKTMAGLMLSAIISDTLLLKSPTCTEQDVAAAHELAEIAGVDLNAYGLDMLKAGADLSTKSIAQLISLDSKEFQMGSYKVEIAQVNAVDVNDVLARKAELEEALSAIISDKGLDLFLFVVTDILNNDSIGLALGRASNAVEKAYNVSLVDNQAVLKGVVSRKKQIVPVLTDTLTNM
ncbi:MULTISPECIES: manganese-dependent inorganic pyrophosphatase [Brevibacillus]|jgi:manganese-dependent inorganic pyrophosphatase|uniref:Probable manganese-dependent inorganic pyrophosphatase n=1 Tax=Brevibacillus borstelensis AK1 TaxID=1300222 RepID=M8DBI4_9BACL|nr:manganese-dependent inorganic pyrophosphatase [Brevibacillus borstelensis]EMT53639.1 manganese-dependent inorganic pyrophosphatase [Brevibacillus borstelensis AK1]KKX52984.1 inorganic pyrophosphatase [Brevibacillus borstelensis cifa_chp40]MBE5397751.1 manganese-dependent inorganic pyrophosphatase [Brevibacillus borstelensis]MCC0562688.1 manganese-dependent inorganic pyrophosphatase [Brevibacillus borstelensis]MCM3469703.1 manganese-dependent inorganic pyrophosphatase [Brevibacillus borstele